jgi:hypothetical protein
MREAYLSDTMGSELHSVIGYELVNVTILVSF